MITRKQLFDTIREYVQEGPPDDQRHIYGVEDRKRAAVLALYEAVEFPAVKQTDTVTVDMLNAMNAYCHPKPEAAPEESAITQQRREIMMQPLRETTIALIREARKLYPNMEDDMISALLRSTPKPACLRDAEGGAG